MNHGNTIIHLACAFVQATLLAAHGQSEGARVALQLDLENTKDVTIKAADAGAYAVETTGGDPYIYTMPSAAPLPLESAPILAFEYFTLTPTDSLQVFFDPPTSASHSMIGEGLGHSEGWTAYTMDLGEARNAWPEAPVRLRLDFGNQPGRTFQIRNIVLRAPTARELELAQGREAKKAAEAKLEADLRAYLDREYPCAVTDVTVHAETIDLRGYLGNHEEGLYMAESPLYENITELTSFVSLTPLEGDGTFSLSLPRFVQTEKGRRDRLLSRWVVVRKKGETHELLSHAHYADTVDPMYDLPREVVRCKKGLGGYSARRPFQSDLDDLGIGSVTVNIYLSFMRQEPGKNTFSFEFNGKTYHADRNAIDHLDKTFLEASKRNLITLAILLVPKSGFLAHPDCDPSGIFSMANVTSEEDLNYYAAALDLLAGRYSRPDRKYGRIHHYIVHNEVDAGWVWTNAGEKTPLLYMDLYHKSMRTVHLIARQYSAHPQAFISLTHYWNWTSDRHFYHSKELLKLLLEFSGAEGDFEWAVAQHPYPESLYEPRVWEDKKVDFTLDTPLITYKNIEVLAAWARQPSTWFRGDTPRVVFLTEQGLNSKTYSDEDLLDQAAGMAYAWKKLEVLDEIQAFQYHNWMDARGEGGLRIGLRRFPDDKTGPGGVKPIWKVYQKLETPEEDEACAFALKHIGIKNWDEVRYTGEIR